MTQTFYIGSSQKQSGKTWVAAGLLRNLSQEKAAAGFKAVDVGRLQYDAEDQLSDGEQLYQAAQMSTHPNLVNPYLLHQSLPAELAAQYEGVTLKKELILDYWNQLGQAFDTRVIEGCSGLCVPVAKEWKEWEWLAESQATALWVCPIGESFLAQTLMDLQFLQQKKIPLAGIVLNNLDQCVNGDLIRYQWMMLEEQLSVRVLGLLPALPSGMEDLDAVAQHLDTHIERFW